MNKLISIISLLILLLSCNQENPIVTENNPITDSTRYKLIYDYDIRKDFLKGDYIGFLILIDFNGNVQYFDKKFGTYSFDQNVFNKNKQFVKSFTSMKELESLFESYKYNSYPTDIPFDIDSNATFHIPFTIETLSWRVKKTDKFYNVTIYPKPVKGLFTYPESFEEFYSKLIPMLQ